MNLAPLFTTAAAIARLWHSRHGRNQEFARAVKQAMQTRLGSDADEALKSLSGWGIGRSLAKQAIELAREQGALTAFAVVNALTRLSRRGKWGVGTFPPAEWTTCVRFLEHAIAG